MNIAILIGISKYKFAAPLPSCVADVAQMQKLLAAAKKYTDIVHITTNTEATPLKEALRNFFGRYQDAGSVEEALVYFSGHGVYHNDVLLCCSDFDPNKPASTSISNSELDDLLRSVAPDVAVKIVDACQSGSPYIKDATPGFEKALRESKLKSFICMASSRADQSSYATAECSVFTDRLIDAALAKDEGTVLYRDIHAALADAFVTTPEQTPFFVTQGTGLEPFAAVTTDMRELRVARTKPQASSQLEDSLATPIAAEVARMDALYVSAEAASRAIQQASEDLGSAVLSHSLVSQFYDKRVGLEGKLATLPRASAVAAFAQEQGWGKKYFVKIGYENYRVRIPKDPLAAFGGSLSLFGTRRLDDSEYVTETQSRPHHLESTQPLPFEVAEVVFEPKGHPSLKAFVLYIGFVHSLTELVVLSGVTRLIEAGWKERSAELSQLKWQYQSHTWKDVVDHPESIWKDALNRGQEAIVAYMEGLVPKKEEAAVPALSHGSTAPAQASKSKPK